MRKDEWTTNQRAKLIELCDKGLGTKQIADEMTSLFCRKFTRNAIIGQAYRMGVPLPKNSRRQGKPRIVCVR